MLLDNTAFKDFLNITNFEYDQIVNSVMKKSFLFHKYAFSHILPMIC